MKKSGKNKKKKYSLSIDKEPLQQPAHQRELTFEGCSFSQPMLARGSNEAIDNQFETAGPSSRTRVNPTKRLNESDSEVEINNSVKLSLMKAEQKWIFVGSKEVHLLGVISELWPENFSYIQRSTLEENKTTTLKIDGMDVSCRLLFKGSKKTAKEVYEKYEAQLKSGVRPESLKVTFVKVDRKRQVFDDVNFLSKTGTNTKQSSLPALGGSPNQSKKPRITSKETTLKTPTQVGPIELRDLPPCPKLTPANRGQDSDPDSDCDMFEEFANAHEMRMASLMKAFNEECVRQTKRRNFLLETLKDQRLLLKEEISYLKHNFQSVDEYPEWEVQQKPVLHDGFDLMTISAGSDVGSFGRSIGTHLFSSGEFNKLISPKRTADKIRSPVSDELSEKFKNVVRQKYPATPNLAYKVARKSYNQLVRDSCRFAENEGHVTATATNSSFQPSDYSVERSNTQEQLDDEA